MPDFKLPDLGEGVTEAEVDRWLVKEGDVISEDDPLVEVITDKATAEIPSPFEGVVARIHVKAGDVVPVGTVLVSIEAEAGSGNGETPAPKVAAVATDAISAAAERVPDDAGDNGVKAMPPVRKLARELGVDLTTVTGTGPGRRITRADVEGAARGATTAPPAARGETPSSGERREPLKGVRRVIAERMSEAHRVVPPVTHVEECDVTELDATRKLANERAPDEQRLTFVPFIVKAVTTSLKEYPALNASLDEDAGEIVFHYHYDIGVAVDTPAGLMVPVVKDADKLRLRALATEIERLATAARGGSLIAHELRGSTFTVTSPGPFGGLMATPIVFHPQSAILGVHRATDRPVVRDGQIVIRKMMNLSITFDHRILDGMTAAKFVLNVVRLLEHPAVLALES
ncbi:MAG TPA: dihydrolipoamide acetyltransferase family protein [Actinomycetota bacterium]|jgi:pyruvate dehydrogenase E2 component (dihydrolipoamide acetyltransferase)